MIPKQIHYTFGFDENFCSKPLSRFHFWNILSAKKYNSEYEFVLHYIYSPVENEWWENIRQVCHLNKINVSNINKLPFKYTEHKVDLFRIELLYNMGGVYFDLDVVCLKSMNNFLSKSCVMGLEHGNDRIIGLCNAIVLSEQHSEFLRIWISEFLIDYREQWEYNCVIMPHVLSQKYPNLIHVEPTESFFKFSWDGLGKKQLFDEINSFEECYCVHLWEHKNYKELTSLDIYKHDNTLSKIYRNII